MSTKTAELKTQVIPLPAQALPEPHPIDWQGVRSLFLNGSPVAEGQNLEEHLFYDNGTFLKQIGLA